MRWWLASSMADWHTKVVSLLWISASLWLFFSPDSRTKVGSEFGIHGHEVRFGPFLQKGQPFFTSLCGIWILQMQSSWYCTILQESIRGNDRQLKNLEASVGPPFFAARKVARVRSNCRLDKRQKQKATSRNSRHSPSVCMPGLWQSSSRPLG